MFSTLPLQYQAGVPLPTLQTLPSSRREWLNVQKEDLKRGLQIPIRAYPSDFAKATSGQILLNNSGVQNQDVILQGRVLRPEEYQLLTDNQALLNLVREVNDTEPTEQDFLDFSNDDQFDVRLIGGLNEEAISSNIYALESENFGRLVQKSINDYVLEKSRYNVPIPVKEQVKTALQSLKGAESQLLAPLEGFRKELRRQAGSVRITSSVIRNLAKAFDLPVVEAVATSVEDAINRGVEIDKITQSIQNNPEQLLLNEILNRLV